MTLRVAKAQDESSSSGSSADGAGVQFRAGTVQGQGVLQDNGTIPLELFPYLLRDNTMLFSDLRFYPTNDFRYGGNLGLGVRHYSSGLDRIFGVSGWYDADNSRNVYFQQIGLSLETYGQILDLRSNLYLPVGPTTRQSSLTLIDGSTQFQNNNVVYNQLRTWYSAMKGFDAEAGVPIPGQFAADHAIRIYGGGYHFKDDAGNDITGGSGRLQANLFSGLDAFVQVTHDNYFDTRGFVGVAWTFGPLHRSQRPETTTFARMGEHVTRNITVLAPKRSEIENVAAINPATGQPYTFAHVANSAAPGGDGSVLRPFQTIAQAQAAGRDIVFVHSNEFFTGADAAIVMAQNQRILGDGTDVQHFINVPNFDSFLLPHGPNPGSRPTLVGSPGNSVVLASNSEFSGFTIVNPGSNGILGDGVQNVTLRNIDVHGAPGAGLSFMNAWNGVTLQDVHVWNSNTGIEVAGGPGGMNFTGNTIISGSTGPSLYVHDLSAGSTIYFNDLNINNRASTGILFDNVAGNIAVNGTGVVTNELASTSSALDIRNSAGQFYFKQFEALDPTGSAGVSLQANTGATTFDTLRVTAHDGTALYANLAGNLFINSGADTSLGGNISAIRGTGVDIRNTNMNIYLTSVSANNSAVGINLLNTTGSFVVMGNGVTGSGGTISNTGVGIQMQNVAGPVLFNWMNLDTNGTGVKGTAVNNLTLSNSFVVNSTAYGMDLLDTTNLNVQSSTFSANAAGNLRAQFDQQSSYAYTLSNSVFTSGAADNVVLTSLGGSEGSTLNFLSQSNTFTNTLANSTGLRVNWDGVLTGTVDHSSFNTYGGASTGVFFNNNSTTSPSTVAYTNNSYVGQGSNNIGFRLDTLGSANSTILANQVTLNGTNGTGLSLTFGGASTGNISDNVITDLTDGATGILLSPSAGVSQFTIGNNTVNLANTGGLLDRGIIVNGGVDPILLINTLDRSNSVSNANTPFAATGNVGGQIFVNGVPQNP